MKTLIFIIIVLVSITTKSYGQASPEAVREYKSHAFSMGGVNIGQGCIDLKLVTLRLGYVILRKLDKKHYELVGEDHDGYDIEFHAFLETVKSEFSNAGRPAGIKVRYMGSKKMGLTNGFSSDVDLWKECEQ